MSGGSRIRRLDKLQRVQRRQLLMVAVVVADTEVSLLGPDPLLAGRPGARDGAPDRAVGEPPRPLPPQKRSELPGIEGEVRARFSHWASDEKQLFTRLQANLLHFRNKRYLTGKPEGPLRLEGPVLDAITLCLPPDTRLDELGPTHIEHLTAKLGFAPGKRTEVAVVSDDFRQLTAPERERHIAAEADYAAMATLTHLVNIMGDDDSNEFARVMAGTAVLNFKGKMALVDKAGKPVHGIDDLEESELLLVQEAIDHARMMKRATTVDVSFEEVDG